jgi:signal transduction histidine kinase
MGTSLEQGTGLGLVLVKELVEANQGGIQVSSEVNKGTSYDKRFGRGKRQMMRKFWPLSELMYKWA